MKKNFLFVAALVLTAGSLASCGEVSSIDNTSASAESTSTVTTVEGTASAYGLVDGVCVSKTTIVVANSLTTSVTIDETFTPGDWASINSEEVTGQDVDVITYSYNAWGTDYNVEMAKFIKIGDKVFTGTLLTEADANNQWIVYSNDEIANLFTYISENAGWYYTQVENDAISIVSDAEGTAFATPYTLGSITAHTTNFKADEDNSYWAGWKTNIASIQTALTGLNLSEKPAVVQDEETGIFSFGGVATGSSLTSTETYVDQAVAAWATL